MQVKELGHAVLYVHDIERSSAFYRDILGWNQITKPDPRFPAAAFSSGRTHHELLLIEVGPEAQEIPQGRRARRPPLGTKAGARAAGRGGAGPPCGGAGGHVGGLSDHTATHTLYALARD